MEAALRDLRGGAPIATFDDVRAEADAWAAFATPFELRAYAWAILRAMPPVLAHRFRAYVSGAERDAA